MDSAKSLIKSVRWFDWALLCTVLGSMILYLFWEPLFSENFLFSMDGRPFYQNLTLYERFEALIGNYKENMLGITRGAVPFHPLYLLKFMPPLAGHIALFIVDPILVVSAAIYLLYGRGIRGYAAWIPSLALGFTGYYFSLISAGHRGVFDMMVYSVWAFAALDRAIRFRSLFHYALVGAFIGFGFTRQPDIQILMIMLAIAHGMFLLLRNHLKSDPAAAYMRHGAGVVLVVLVYLLTASSSFEFLFERVIPSRMESIDQMAKRGNRSDASWEYATDWSMPPEQMLEFICPSVFGFEPQDLKTGPYWGRLGQSIRWDETKQGFMNYRQHNLYLGAIPLIFVIYGLVAAFRRNGLFSMDAERTDLSAAGPDIRRSDVFFWSGALLVCLTLSFGRYFFVYRLFHMIPHLSRIRCPVKFIHLAAICICFLFAYGLANFFTHLRILSHAPRAGGNRRGQKKSELSEMRIFLREKRHVSICSLVIMSAALFLLFCSLWMTRSPAAMIGHWQELGLDSYSSIMLHRMSAAIRHGAIIFLLVAALFTAARFSAQWRWMPRAISTTLLILLAIDLSLAGRPYVRTRNIKAFYASNPVADHILRDGRKIRLSDMVSRRNKFDPIWVNLDHHRVDLLEPRTDRKSEPEYQEYFGSLQKHLLRLWQLTNTGFAIVPATNGKHFAGRNDIETVGHFTLGRDGQFRTSQEGTANVLLLAYKDALPRALIYHDWVSDGKEEVLRRIVSPAWDPGKQVMVSGDVPFASPGRATTTSVNIIRYQRTHKVIVSDSPSRGILLLNDKYDPQWEVCVDGEPADLLRGNYIAQAVAVPKGKHTVTFKYRPNRHTFGLSIVTCLILIGWGICRRKHQHSTRVSV